MPENINSNIHPLSQVMLDAILIFQKIGFNAISGPEIEDEWHNFDALNVPKDHPARDAQDTFFLKDQPGFLMRTHTSNTQIRFLEKYKAPCQVIVPGKVFRNEATDATHEAQFHQLEGLYLGTDISLAHLKGTLEYFLKNFLGQDVKMRFRPGYFPFVEPGIEVDLFFNGRWLEVLGAGMVHHNVLKNVGIDPEKIQGFAFGIGIDRMAMLKYRIPDVRYFYNGDLRLHKNLIAQN